jgi:hypothetical protein
MGAIASDLPLLASFIASQATRRSELISIAFELRKNRKVVAFRHWIDKLDQAIATQSDLGKLAAASRELQQLVADLRRDLGIKVPNDTGAGQAVLLKLGVPLGIAGVAGLEASAETTIHAKVPESWRRIFRRRTHLIFLRDLARRAPDISPFTVAFGRLSA